jgi:hypothetical protein
MVLVCWYAFIGGSILICRLRVIGIRVKAVDGVV